MKKDKLESMCRMAGMQPAHRENLPHGEVLFVSEGFSAQPHITYQKFGASKDDFPYGAYCAAWFVANGEDHVVAGQPLLFDAFHDTGWDMPSKKRARVNRALEEAHAFLEARDQVRADA